MSRNLSDLFSQSYFPASGTEEGSQLKTSGLSIFNSNAWCSE